MSTDRVRRPTSCNICSFVSTASVFNDPSAACVVYIQEISKQKHVHTHTIFRIFFLRIVRSRRRVTRYKSDGIFPSRTRFARSVASSFEVVVAVSTSHAGGETVDEGADVDPFDTLPPCVESQQPCKRSRVLKGGTHRRCRPYARTLPSTFWGVNGS